MSRCSHTPHALGAEPSCRKLRIQASFSERLRHSAGCSIPFFQVWCASSGSITAGESVPSSSVIPFWVPASAVSRAAWSCRALGQPDLCKVGETTFEVGRHFRGTRSKDSAKVATYEHFAVAESLDRTPACPAGIVPIGRILVDQCIGADFCVLEPTGITHQSLIKTTILLYSSAVSATARG